MSDTLPPLPHQEWLGYDPEQGNLHGYSADQMREYAAEALAAERERQHEQMRQLMSELIFDEPAAVAEPVAYSIGRTLHWHPGRGINDAQLYAAPPQREPLPAGFRLVPVEPTREFVKKVQNHGVWEEHEVRNLYADILAALGTAVAEPAASGEPAGMPPAPKACLSATPSAGRPDDACPEEWCSVLGQCRIGYKWGSAPAPAEDMAAAVAEPVASVTECEACFTPDVCQLRGTCDHYAAERLRVAAPPQREPLNTGESGFMFQVGEEYETQAGELVRVIGRTTECLQCSDGMYRYDRKGNPGDAGRVTGTEHDYSFRGNFKRALGISAPASAPKEQA